MGMTPQHFHTIPTSCAILPSLTQICCVQRVVEGSVVGSAGSACWCAWGVGYVVGGCNVQCTCYTDHGRRGLSCLYAETVESMSSACWVCIVCMVCVVYGLYGRLDYLFIRLPACMSPVAFMYAPNRDMYFSLLCSGLGFQIRETTSEYKDYCQSAYGEHTYSNNKKEKSL